MLWELLPQKHELHMQRGTQQKMMEEPITILNTMIMTTATVRRQLTLYKGLGIFS